MMLRRTFFKTGTAAMLGTHLSIWGGYRSAAADEVFEVTFTEAEWRSRLKPEQFAVLREEDTEKPFSSPLYEEKREGVFACAGCNLPLYSSIAKYDSGTGWPSFFEAIPDAIRTKEDNTFFTTRTEAHCRRCGGHLGHIFEDGPQPTGKRHCINGVSLDFVPKTA
jgi:peptide-methionine (R)-S-oxide reductase